MDSLTQYVLGAAMGEAVAGRRLGNKAMLWGALAGTIPDLDVISNLWMADIEALAFHRGITHSILFSVTMPLLLAALSRWYYRSVNLSSPLYSKVWSVIWILASAILVFSGGYMVYVTHFHWASFILLILLCAIARQWLSGLKYTIHRTYEPISFSRWYVLFFMAIATHILIDAFTTYGTQILQPFSDKRFTTSSISVVDPLYTMPLLCGLLVASFYPRLSMKRSLWFWGGMIVSILYVVFTFGVKRHVDQAFEQRLADDQIAYTRSMSNPSLFNAILWHGIAETDDAYVEGYYSIFDMVIPFHMLRYIPKNHHLMTRYDCADSYDADVLRWFSDGFYQYSEVDGMLRHRDLRFGQPWIDDPNEEEMMVFYFQFDDDCHADEIRGTADVSTMFQRLWQRMKGIH